MSKPKLLEIRKFNGATLADCVTYLKRDLSKSLSDLFVILSQKSKDQRFGLVVNELGTVGASNADCPMSQINLPKGRWLLMATATFDEHGTNQIFSYASMWLTRISGSGIGGPSDTIKGYNRATVENNSGDYNRVPLTVQWLIDMENDGSIYLEGLPVYAGGAGAPSFRCAITAHGYVME